MKNKSKKRLFGPIIVTIIVLTLILTILVIIESGALNSENKEELKIEIPDRCTLMFNNILHQIKSENNCITVCKQECDSRNKEYKIVEFVENATSCHKCDCYCI